MRFIDHPHSTRSLRAFGPLVTVALLFTGLLIFNPYLGSTVALLCLVAFASSGPAQVAEDPAVATRLAQLPAEIDASQRALTNLQAQLAEAQARLDAARAVAHQPDWSVLLRLLAQSLCGVGLVCLTMAIALLLDDRDE